LFEENGDLDDFDVAVGGVPVAMGVCYNEPGAGLAVFQEADDGDVVARHDAVEDVVLGFHVRAIDGSVGIVDVLFVQKNVPGKKGD